MVTWRRVTTPLGEVAIVADDDWLTELNLPGDAGVVPADAVEGGPTVDRAAAQLAEWFAGERRHFDLPLAPVGTAFQRRVWAALVSVPYGETATYGDIAAAIGQPTATRAVGAANGRNPIPLIIPCHRVIGSNGAMVGYSGGGGVATKRYLLNVEQGVLTLDVP
jgi:methylated-DNA-[protein]-cysteine S-methyltransferase